jgi:hypothetical protein
MKTNNTDEQLQHLASTLERALHERLFTFESGDPKRNAQRNLSGRTHYVDDETLRWHKSRISTSSQLHWGLLFSVVASDALDMHNTKRGFRAAVFDLFGTCVSRPTLENAFSSASRSCRRL